MPGRRIAPILDRLFVIGERALHVASVVADFASIGVSLGEAAVDIYGAVEFGHRPVVFSLRLQDDGAIIMSLAVTRIERDGMVEVVHRPIRIAFGVIRDAAITPGVGKRRVEFDGFVEFGDRPIKISPRHKRDATIVTLRGGLRRLRLSSMGCERQRERRRRDYCHDDSWAEQLFPSFTFVNSILILSTLRSAAI